MHPAVRAVPTWQPRRLSDLPSLSLVTLKYAMLFAVAWLGAFGVAGPRLAHAQEKPIEQRAMEHFERSKRLYEEGRFMDSLRELQSAHRLVPHRDLLFNIAKLQEKLKLKREALASFREYLAQYPSAPERPRIEPRIDRLKAEIDEEDKAAAAAARRSQPVLVVPPPAERPSVARRIGIWPVLVVVAGGVMIIAGGIEQAGAISDAGDCNSGKVKCVNAAGQKYPQAVLDKFSLGNNLLIAGSVVAGAGVTWAVLNAILRNRTPDRTSSLLELRGLRVEVSPYWGPAAQGVSLQGHF